MHTYKYNTLCCIHCTVGPFNNTIFEYNSNGKKGLQPTLSPSIDSAEVPTHNIPQVGKSACIVLAKERHSKGERVPFSACFQLVSKLKSEAASTLSLMFQIFLEKNYHTPWLECLVTKNSKSVVWYRYHTTLLECLVVLERPSVVSYW